MRLLPTESDEDAEVDADATALLVDDAVADAEDDIVSERGGREKSDMGGLETSVAVRSGAVPPSGPSYFGNNLIDVPRQPRLTGPGSRSVIQIPRN